MTPWAGVLLSMGRQRPRIDSTSHMSRRNVAKNGLATGAGDRVGRQEEEGPCHSGTRRAGPGVRRTKLAGQIQFKGGVDFSTIETIMKLLKHLWLGSYTASHGILCFLVFFGCFFLTLLTS